MLPNHLARLAFLGLVLSLAPAALAGDESACPDGTTPTPEGCSQQAWVEDCPPDMLCAAGGPDADPANGNVTEGNATDEPTFGDCGAEVCAYGNETCIECNGPVPDQ